MTMMNWFLLSVFGNGPNISNPMSCRRLLAENSLMSRFLLMLAQFLMQSLSLKLSCRSYWLYTSSTDRLSRCRACNACVVSRQLWVGTEVKEGAEENWTPVLVPGCGGGGSNEYVVEFIGLARARHHDIGSNSLESCTFGLFCNQFGQHGCSCLRFWLKVHHRTHECIPEQMKLGPLWLYFSVTSVVSIPHFLHSSGKKSPSITCKTSSIGKESSHLVNGYNRVSASSCLNLARWAASRSI